MEILKLEKFSTGYVNNFIIKSIDLSIESGEWLGVIGPNGSGKSTLIKGICRIIKPHHGRIFLKENDICKKIKIIACIKCLGRAEKWYRRNYKKTFFSNINFLRFKYYLTKNNENDFIKKSCEVFYKKDVDIRYKIQ